MTIVLTIVHVIVCAMLMGVVLLQQGRGGGMGAAFGGAGTQVFGGSGAGNILTRATAVTATIFMLNSVALAWMSSTGDRAMKARIQMEAQKKNERGTLRKKEKPATTTTPPEDSAPATTTTPPENSAPSPTGSTQK
jgi:preprotein translocase subunit SecG